MQDKVAKMVSKTCNAAASHPEDIALLLMLLRTAAAFAATMTTIAAATTILPAYTVMETTS